MNRPLVSPRKTVLAVGKESAALELLRASLESADYRVLSAPDGESALRILPRSLCPIHLLIADAEMEPMSGMMLAMGARSLHATLPVLLISSADELPEEVAGCKFLHTPFRPRVLVQMVNKIIAIQESSSDTPSLLHTVPLERSH